MPSDKGILASVEEQSRWLRIPKGASTARIDSRRGASAASPPPGREPISLIFVATRPVPRLFSSAIASSTEVASSKAISSMRAALSERRSTLARASLGMELMLDPPSISPKLKEDLGPLVGARSLNVGDGAAQGVDRIAHTVIRPGMSAGPGHGDVKTAAGERLRGDAVRAGAVEDEKSFDPGGNAGPAKITHAGKVSFSLLADVGDQHGGQRRIVQGPRGFPCGRQGEERGEPSAVIGDSGAEQLTIGRGLDVVGGARGEDRIEMCRQRDQRRLATAGKGGHHVAGAVDFGIPFEVSKTGRDPFGALLFKESGRRDTAKLEVLFLNPEPFPAEPLEGGAHRGSGGEIGDGLGEYGQVLV